MFKRRSNEKRLTLALGLFVFAWTAHATLTGEQQTASGGSLNGRWKEISKKNGLAFTIESQPDGLLLLKNAREYDPLHEVGEIIGEARPLGKDEWIGRHKWGGTR